MRLFNERLKKEWLEEFIRKARDFDRALMAGCDAFGMSDQVKAYKRERLYKSHIRPPPSAYDDL